ncbi:MULTISPECIES: lantibiotic dehydratase [unclassified Frankia]|uniref:lantibiotic dehydratase n=1 Tax=unclassified Frankia TaxID=2632575 RepID=UPI002AD333B5|nr:MULTISPECIES: lantibiotic dehydratase [unclassified Frankia]
MAVPRGPFTVSTVVAGLARIPLLPAHLLSATSDRGEALLAEGVFLASRQASAAADTARRAVTLRGYDLRARWRPTPMGVFAGVATASFLPSPAVELSAGVRHRARSRPSATWLTGVAAMVVGDPAVLPRLTLHANNLAIHRGRLLEGELPGFGGGTGPSRITIRATDATTTIMRLCVTGINGAELLTELAGRWPGTPASTVEAAVLGMVRTGFLLTDLLPANLSDDPLTHLSARLPDDHHLHRQLRRLQEALAAADYLEPGAPARLEALHAARDVADAICFQERPLTVDVAADATIALPLSLAQDACEAAGVLWLVGGSRDPLTGFHDRFLDRYGVHRRVPLLDAVDPAVGLGLDLDRGPGHEDESPADRAAALSRLYHQALTAGGDEVVLNDGDIKALRVPGGELPPRTAEIYVRVVADSETDRQVGRFTLAVCPRSGSQDAGSTAGRFTGLLPDLKAGTDHDPHALVAELLIAPRSATAASLAIPTGLADANIPVGIPAGEGSLPLDDLMLASNGRHLTVWSARHDRRVVPILYSRVAPGLLPPLARFLQLAGRAGTRPWRAWSWGLLDDAPFQPRVIHRGVVLAPARWVLPPNLCAAAHSPTWDEAVQAWAVAARPRPPAVVVTDDADRRIPLDLRRSDDRALLGRHVRQGLHAVTEPPGGHDAIQDVVPSPDGNHILELTIPLARRETAPSSFSLVHAPSPARRTGQGLYLPGTSWLSLAIRSPVRCQDELLAELAALTEQHAHDVDRWFWLRYTTSSHGPHLRARFHGRPDLLTANLLPALSAWSATTITRRLSGGFTVEPYEQETERYGGPGAIGAAERAFAADSHLVINALAATRDGDHRRLIAALCAAAIADTVADRDSAALGRSRLDRDSRRHLAALRPQVRAAYRDPAHALRAHPAWNAWQTALLAYRDLLTPERRPGCASVLIHLHANRLLGGTRDEPQVRVLATDLLRLPT